MSIPGPLRVAIVGSGGIAPAHAEAYAATGRTRLVGVVDVVPDRAKQFAERFGCPHHYASVAELLSDQAVDIVSVTTPPGTHTEIAVQILQAGTSVLLEKPPCLTLADLDVIAEAEAAQCRLGLRRLPAPARLRRPPGEAPAQLRCTRRASGGGVRNPVVPAGELLRPDLARHLER